MGLAISVGLLADLQANDPEGAQWVNDELRKINGVLLKLGLRAHVEGRGRVPSARACTSFPYSFLHYLRRAYVCHIEGKALRDGDITETDDRLIADISMDMSSHLLCHSDCEGWYVPVDFDEPIFDDNIPGGEMLGSSQKLLAEVLSVAEFLGIEVIHGAPSDAAKRELEAIEDDGPNWRARLVWYTVWEAAQLSVTHKTAISFH